MKKPCKNCDGKFDDYYGSGYPCDQCYRGWQFDSFDEELEYRENEKHE